PHPPPPSPFPYTTLFRSPLLLNCTSLLLLLVYAQEHLLPVRSIPWRRCGVRVVFGRPAGEDLGVVLVPGDALGHGDHGDLLEHDLLDLIHDLVLLSRVCGRGELLDELVGVGVVETPVITRCRLPERGRGLAVDRVPQFVPRRWAGQRGQ